jgi:phytoene dehydrogenase-like protein
MTRHVVIIGGGLAGLSAGCYALRSGYRVTIIEHNVALGGVCTAWQRGPYTIDGCIHWLTGGAFTRIYEELDILPEVPVRVLSRWATYRHARDGFEIEFTRDLDAVFRELVRHSREDAAELERLRKHAAAFAEFSPPIDAQELSSFGDMLHGLWEMRGAAPALLHFRKPVAVWAKEHLVSPRLQRLFTRMFPEAAPAVFVLMVLGYLEKGYLSRPVGGTAAFRDALIKSFWDQGGSALLDATADEIIVRDGRARAVRLADGTIVEADIVISTASAPETVLRMLGSCYDAEATRRRLENWKVFDPIVMASFGVAKPYADTPSLLIVDGIEPFYVGGRRAEDLYVRACNDDASFAPPGNSVVQAMVATDYDWWATRGAEYAAAKDEAAYTVLARLEPHFSGIRDAVRMIDVATPLTYWNMARSWRGAYEGWMPNADSFFGHIKKTLAGLQGFYMAGQWVEPGGGVPTALMSGRQVIQLVCHDDGAGFVARRKGA